MRLNTLRVGIMLAVASCTGLATAQDTLPAYAELSALAASGGELQLFAIRKDNEIERRYQPQPGGGFSGVEVLGGLGLDIAAVRLPDGGFDAFILGMDSAVWENQQQSDGSWSGWIRLGGEASRVAAVSTSAGDVALLTLRGKEGSADGELELRLRAAGSDAWSEPQALGFQAKRLAAVANEGDASLTLFAIGLDDAVWRGTLDLAAGSSSDWESLGGLVHDIAAARTASGVLEVVLVGDDDAMWCNVEEDGAFAGWHQVGGEVARVDLAEAASGIQFFGVTPSGGVTTSSLDAQREWSAFAPLALDAPPSETAQPLDTTFRGQVQVNIPSLDVSVTRDLSFDLRFSADRAQVQITTFAPIVTDPFDTPFGQNASTVTWVGGGQGTFDPSTGRVDVPVTLHFDQSLSIPFVNPDVDATFALSTAADGGAALDPESGQLALAAGSTFTGSGANPLRGAEVRVVLTGALDPKP